MHGARAPISFGGFEDPAVRAHIQQGLQAGLAPNLPAHAHAAAQPVPGPESDAVVVTAAGSPSHPNPSPSASSEEVGVSTQALHAWRAAGGRSEAGVAGHGRDRAAAVAEAGGAVSFGGFQDPALRAHIHHSLARDTQPVRTSPGAQGQAVALAGAETSGTPSPTNAEVIRDLRRGGVPPAAVLHPQPAHRSVKGGADESDSSSSSLSSLFEAHSHQRPSSPGHQPSSRGALGTRSARTSVAVHTSDRGYRLTDSSSTDEDHSMSEEVVRGVTSSRSPRGSSHRSASSPAASPRWV